MAGRLEFPFEKRLILDQRDVDPNELRYNGPFVDRGEGDGFHAELPQSFKPWPPPPGLKKQSDR